MTDNVENKQPIIRHAATLEEPVYTTLVRSRLIFLKTKICSGEMLK